MKKTLYSLAALLMAAFTLTGCEDVPMPYDDPNNNTDPDEPTVVIEPTGDGTLDNPFNVAAAINYTSALESDVESTDNIYIKGIVTSVKESYSTTYGNATFYISDDADATNEFYVFRTLYLGNKKYTSGDQPQVGDTVIICGAVINYMGNTPETVTNKSYLYSLNGNTGTTDTPETGDVLTAVDGVFINETFASDFGVFSANTPKGTAWVIDFSTAKATGYDNTSKTTTPSQSYLISKPMDMTNTKAATVSFEYILRYYTSNGSVKSGVEDKVLITSNYTGDPTTTTWTDITGTLTEGSDWTTFSTYKAAVPAACLGQSRVVVALYYACESNSATWEVKNMKVAEGAGDTPAGEGVSISGTTVTLTNANATAGTEQISIDLSTLGKENGADMGTVTLSDGTTIVFDANGETNGPKYYSATKGARVYKNNTITFNGKTAIATVVMECDSYSGTDYVGNDTATLAADGNKLVYTNVYTGTSGGGVQLRVKTITITYAK